MSYTKTEWIDNVTIVDATKLNKIEDQLETLDTQKVSRDGNKGLSSNDFTDALKSKVENIDTRLDTKVDKDGNKVLSDNNFTNELKQKVEGIDALNTTLDTKVDKVNGKTLTSNDFTDEYKSKLDNLESTISTSIEDKVDKEDGKSLSSNDFTDDYKSKVESMDGLQLKVDKLESVSDVIEITSIDGNITLDTNRIYRTTISEDTTFVLPATVEDNKFNQILVQANISDGVNIDFGTEYYFGSGYQGDAGNYNFIFEHNGSDWVYGALYTGGQ